MRPPASLRGGLRRGAAPAVVLFTGLLASSGAALYVSRVVDAQQDARFNETVATSAEALQRRMDAYVEKLRSFISSFELSRYYPGVQGIGWARALRPEELAAHEAAMRAAGFADFR